MRPEEPIASVRDLHELTTHCIRCGFCLESCPTFKVTGKETESPRGRIYLVRSALEGKLDWQDDVRPHLDLCLGCRACETACPSGVEYGSIFEMARDQMEREKGRPTKSALLSVITNPGLMRMQVALSKLMPGEKLPGIMSRFFTSEPPQVQKPRPQPRQSFPPLDSSTLPPIRGKVLMLEGCVMRVLFDPVNEATRRLLRRIGFEVEAIDLGCCGALHAHNGQLEAAKSLASQLQSRATGDLPIVVNSAGCGSTMKEYRHLDPSLQAVGERVFDASEFLFQNGLLELLETAPGLPGQVATYHDACHLAHGQGIREEPRKLISAIPGLKLVEMDEADTCCGSAGIYNVLQPTMARTLLERKYAHIEATGANVVVTGNPGCHAWIAQAAREHGKKLEVLHTIELLERAFLR